MSHATLESSRLTPAGSAREPDREVRAWGSWQVLAVDHGYKVQQVRVAPGARLALRAHTFRNEHWVVIFGVATCTVGDRVFHAVPGEALDVPRGVTHGVANDTQEELVLIEVQQGAYTGEDDVYLLDDSPATHLDPELGTVGSTAEFEVEIGICSD